VSAAALLYEPHAAGAERIEVPAGGVQNLPGVGAALKAALLAAVVELRPRRDARVEVLGEDVARLAPRARALLGLQVAWLPADGGMISHLNGWENIALPHAYHAPRTLAGLAPRARALLEQAGAEAQSLFARLPEDMSPQERRLAAYVRMRLGRPRLVLAEELSEAQAAAYLADCPEGTLVLLQDAPDESG
jgi:predicted ABC-type transport system involved in lysophospholipase L1 biosynthesis ATPase subunit